MIDAETPTRYSSSIEGEPCEFRTLRSWHTVCDMLAVAYEVTDNKRLALPMTYRKHEPD